MTAIRLCGLALVTGTLALAATGTPAAAELIVLEYTFTHGLSGSAANDLPGPPPMARADAGPDPGDAEAARRRHQRAVQRMQSRCTYSAASKRRAAPERHSAPIAVRRAAHRCLEAPSIGNASRALYTPRKTRESGDGRIESGRSGRARPRV